MLTNECVGCDECGDEGFKLRSGDETEEGSLSDSSFRRASITSTGSSNGSTGWESSLSEIETDMDADNEEAKAGSEAFKSMRSQHYFMKQSLQRGKELIETDEDDEFNE